MGWSEMQMTVWCVVCSVSKWAERGVIKGEQPNGAGAHSVAGAWLSQSFLMPATLCRRVETTAEKRSTDGYDPVYQEL